MVAESSTMSTLSGVIAAAPELLVCIISPACASARPEGGQSNTALAKRNLCRFRPRRSSLASSSSTTSRPSSTVTVARRALVPPTSSPSRKTPRRQSALRAARRFRLATLSEPVCRGHRGGADQPHLAAAARHAQPLRFLEEQRQPGVGEAAPAASRPRPAPPSNRAARSAAVPPGPAAIVGQADEHAAADRHRGRNLVAGTVREREGSRP